MGRPTIQAIAGARNSLGLRVTAQLKNRLTAAARASGRSQSQEAEFRMVGFHSRWMDWSGENTPDHRTDSTDRINFVSTVSSLNRCFPAKEREKSTDPLERTFRDDTVVARELDFSQCSFKSKDTD